MPAFLAGGLWLLVAVMCFVFAGANSTDGKGIRTTPELATALLGLAFGRSVVGNGDATVAATYSAGGMVLLLAALLLARLKSTRWILAAFGLLVVFYYIFAVIYFATHHAPGQFLIAPIIALVVWLVAVVVSMLPPVGRAMRGYRPPQQVNRW